MSCSILWISERIDRRNSSLTLTEDPQSRKNGSAVVVVVVVDDGGGGVVDDVSIVCVLFDIVSLCDDRIVDESID